MSFLKQLIWTLPLSAGGILLGMTRNPQAIIAGLMICFGLMVKCAMIMRELTEDFLRSLEAQSNSFNAIASKFDWIIKKQKQEESEKK